MEFLYLNEMYESGVWCECVLYEIKLITIFRFN